MIQYVISLGNPKPPAKGGKGGKGKKTTKPKE